MQITFGSGLPLKTQKLRPRVKINDITAKTLTTNSPNNHSIKDIVWNFLLNKVIKKINFLNTGEHTEIKFNKSGLPAYKKEFNSAGKLETHTSFRPDGETLDFRWVYHPKGEIKTQELFGTNGEKIYKKTFAPDGKCQRVIGYYKNGKARSINEYDENGNLKKLIQYERKGDTLTIKQFGAGERLEKITECNETGNSIRSITEYGLGAQKTNMTIFQPDGKTISEMRTYAQDGKTFTWD